MPEASGIHATLEGSPATIRLARVGVDDEAWYQVGLTLDDDARNSTSLMWVRPESVVRERLRLRGTLRHHGINFYPDRGVRTLLERGINDATALRDALAGRPSDPHPVAAPTVAPYELRRELRPFQERDLERLSRLRHGANFSVPGAGKTTVSYALHAMAQSTGIVTKLLVVGPLSAFSAWEEDAPKVLAPAPRVIRWRQGRVPDCEVLLVNYQRLSAASRWLIDWMLENPVHLVVDEAHRAKRGAAGEWGRALQALAPFAVRRDILTGTPAPNHPRDLASILDVLWPGGIASSTLPGAALRPDPPDAVMTDVQRAIAPLYVRTTKAELELPPVRIVRDPVPMGDLQHQIYSALISQYTGVLDLDRRDETMLAQMGEVLMHLIQAASSPRLLADAIGPRAYRFPPLAIPVGSRLASMIESYADHELPSKIERTCRIVHANAIADRKTLVWSNFPGNLLDLERQLEALRPALFYGGISSDESSELGVRTRDRELQRFKHDDDCMVLLANPAAMSEGVSLHLECHDAVYVDRTFNAGQYLQSLDRIHRLGLRSDVETRITLLMSENSIDQRVDLRVESKTRRLSRILSDPMLVQMALPDDDDPGDFYDERADLEDVMNYLAGFAPTAES